MSAHAYDVRCLTCGAVTSVVSEPGVCPPCACGGATERIWTVAPTVQDDTLPGGPRWMENLGHAPVWVETKTQFRAELDRRGLVQQERGAYNKADQSPFATPTRFRAGFTPTKADLALMRQAAALGTEALVTPKDEYTLSAHEVAALTRFAEALRGIGAVAHLVCPSCGTFVEAHNRRGAPTWSMACACRRWTHGTADPVARVGADA